MRRVRTGSAGGGEHVFGEMPGEMHDYTRAGKTLPALNQELLALQNEKWGVDQISEGMEIRTGRPLAVISAPKLAQGG